MTRIFLVDDHVIFRDGMKALINDLEGYKVVAEADNGKQALEIIEVIDIDIVITDLHMPTMDGIKLTRHLISKFPAIKIIILTVNSEQTYIEKVKEIGAFAYLSKTCSSEDLENAFKKVKTEDVGFYLEIGSQGAHDSEKSSNARNSNLTNREREILKLIAEGLTDKEIASKLFLSPYTVISHRKNMLSKLNLKNKIELARFAIEHNLG